MPTPANTVAARFATLCGATVDLIHLAEPRSERADHAWTCHGCGDTSPFPQHLVDARRNANDHAGTCRSKPLTTT